MRRRAIAALVILACLPCATACGYRLHRSGDLSEAKTVAIVTLVNASTQPGIELVVSEALRKEFLRRGILALIPDPGRADLVVGGEVLPFRIRSRSVSSVQGALEYSIYLGLDLRIRGRKGSSVDGLAFAVPNMVAYTIYPASADVETARNNRQEALRRAADILATRAYDALELRLTP